MTEMNAEQQYDIGLKNIILEEKKAKLNFRRSIWISGFVAMTVALIPPTFQFAAEVVDYLKSNRDNDNKAQQFESQYVSAFLEKALNQDVEIRLRLADYFRFIANSEAQRVRWQNYHDALSSKRDTIRKEILRLAAEQIMLETALDRKAENEVKLSEIRQLLLWGRAELGYLPIEDSATPIAAIPTESRAIMAKLIVDKFDSAGFGDLQQIAAVMVAIKESNLNPRSRITVGPRGNIGLYMIKLPDGYISPDSADLIEPNRNIEFALKLISEDGEFHNAQTLERAFECLSLKISGEGDMQNFARYLNSALQVLPDNLRNALLQDRASVKP